MRARHMVTLGIGIGAATAMAAFSGCGTDTFGTCADTKSCSGDGSVDVFTGDQHAGNDSTNGGEGGDAGAHDSGVKEGGDGGVLPEAGCPAPTTLDCVGTCVDPTLPAHCGTCGNACGGPDAGAGQATCTAGHCGVGCEADSSTPLNCSGACVDPTLPLNCGMCGYSCKGPASTQGQPTCSLDGGGLPLDAGGDGGPCGITCNPTYHSCGADCLSDSDDPSADPCVVSNTTGVFVSSTAAAGGTGTMASPFNTVVAGIAQAIGGKKRVYVCIGTYGEQLALTGADDGLTVYGNLDCANGWKYTSTGTTVVATPTGKAAPATALTVTGPMSTGVVFQDVGFTSLDGVIPGDSSVAVFATTTAKLTLTRGTVTAGKGIGGSTGGTSPNWTGTAPAGNPNGPPTATSGGAGGSNACSDGSTSAGGSGGSFIGATNQWTGGAPGVSQPSVGAPAANGGNGGPGTIGTGGAVPTQVGPGATSGGDIGAGGWSLGAPGGPGHSGTPAQGGGGGGGSATTAAGGGGGSGGCGGGAGLQGTTGGSSFGILAYQSALALSNVAITTSLAGAGGPGGPGQAGQSGGGGGAGFAGTGFSGGPGGAGSAGSGGGGGAGGDSVGIAWLGSTGPSVNGAVVSTDQSSPYLTITAGATGAAGPGGAGVGPAGNPGAVGSANAIQKFP